MDRMGGLRRASPANDESLASQIDSVKQEVLEKYQPNVGDNNHLLRLSLIEADALARQTGYPRLFFPLLASEKASNAVRWQFRQQAKLPRPKLDYALTA